MTDWQPIETAPKDGTRILVFEKIWPEIVVAEWDEGTGHHPGWRVYPNTESLDTCDPTHWMPLPEPPVAADQAA
jgi:hypothetical protein